MANTTARAHALHDALEEMARARASRAFAARRLLDFMAGVCWPSLEAGVESVYLGTGYVRDEAWLPCVAACVCGCAAPRHGSGMVRADDLRIYNYFGFAKVPGYHSESSESGHNLQSMFSTPCHRCGDRVPESQALGDRRRTAVSAQLPARASDRKPLRRRCRSAELFQSRLHYILQINHAGI
jgi:hypothetical protein